MMPKQAPAMPSSTCAATSTVGLRVTANIRQRSGSILQPSISTMRRPWRSANRPTAGEARATMICGSTIQAAISRLGLEPLAVRVPLISISVGALANVNSNAQPQKISSRRSPRTRNCRALLCPASLGGADNSTLATATPRNGSSASSAGSNSASSLRRSPVSAAVR